MCNFKADLPKSSAYLSLCIVFLEVIPTFVVLVFRPPKKYPSPENC